MDSLIFRDSGFGRQAGHLATRVFGVDVLELGTLRGAFGAGPHNHVIEMLIGGLVSLFRGEVIGSRFPEQVLRALGKLGLFWGIVRKKGNGQEHAKRSHRLQPIMLLALCALPLAAQQPVLLTTGAAVIGQVNQAAASNPWIVAGAGTAGTPGSAVLTIQGISGGTTVPVSGTVTTTAPTPTTSSTYAFTKSHASSAAAGNIKASAGNLYGMVLGNSGSNNCWVQLFNNAGTPAAGTSVIDSYMVQAGLTVVIPPGVLALENFSTGIAFAGATTDSGSTTTGCTTTLSTTFYYD